MNLDCSQCNPSFFYINVGCGQQRNLTNHRSFSMIKASQNKGVSYEENF